MERLPALGPTREELQTLGCTLTAAFGDTLSVYFFREHRQITFAGAAMAVMILATPLWVDNSPTTQTEVSNAAAPAAPPRQVAVDRRASNVAFDEAIARSNQRIGANPDDAAAWVARGDVYKNANNFEKAINDYTTAIRIDPNSFDSVIARADAYQKAGDKEDALKDFQQARQIAARPSRDSQEALSSEIETQDEAIVSALVSRADAYRKKGEIDRALSDYQAALEASPNNVEALIGRALAHEQTGDVRQALSDYDLAIKIDPKNATVYLERGQAYQRKGDLVLAKIDFRKAIELDSTNTQAYLQLGDAYQSSGQLDQAIASYDQALQTSSGKDVAVALVYRGSAYQAKGDEGAAIADYGAASSVAQASEYYLPARVAAGFK